MKYPYLFRFITEDEYKQQEHPINSTTNLVEGFESSIDRAQNLHDRAVALLKERTVQVKKVAIKVLIKKVLGLRRETKYLQLLCGWTFEPVVSYQFHVDMYPEKVKKFAQMGAKLSTVALKATFVYNTASQVALMFGYPLPLIPDEMVKKANELLIKVCESSPFEELKDTEGDGCSLEELSIFGKFLDELERDKKMTQWFDKRNDLEKRSWRDALKPELVELEGNNKQITYVSVRSMERLKQLKTHLPETQTPIDRECFPLGS